MVITFDLIPKLMVAFPLPSVVADYVGQLAVTYAFHIGYMVHEPGEISALLIRLLREGIEEGVEEK